MEEEEVNFFNLLYSEGRIIVVKGRREGEIVGYLTYGSFSYVFHQL